MPYHNPSYVSHYGVGLLDDLHNYFPAVLYEPASFHSVADLLTYISSRTRRHFDLYGNARMAYDEIHGPASVAPSVPLHVPVPVPLSVPSRQYTETSSYAGNETRGIRRRTNLTIPATSNVLAALLAGLSDLNARDSVRDSAIYQILLSSSLPRAASNFMEPVTVRPTQEQINAATRIGLPNDPTEVCTICQETIEENQSARLILHCNHWFHTNCIDVWFQQNVHCPVCRHDIRYNDTNVEVGVVAE